MLKNMLHKGKYYGNMNEVEYCPVKLLESKETESGGDSGESLK